MRRSNRDRIVDAFVVYPPIIILSLSIIYPFYYMLINSFNESLAHHWEYFWPKNIGVGSYQIVFRDEGIILSVFVTALRTVTGIIVTVFNSALCAFALRKRSLSLRNFYLALFIIPMFFSGGLIPKYLVFQMYGLLNTFWVYIIPRILHFFYIIILMAFFNSISNALEDSAKIDGAGYFKIFFRIYLPLSLPVLAVIALFSGVAQWQEWLDTIYFTRSQWLTTLPAILIRAIRNAQMIADNVREMSVGDDEYIRYANNNPDGVKLATMFVAIVPVLCIYPFLQKYFVKGLMIGSLKE